MVVLRFTSVIKIRDDINPYILVTPAQAKTLKPGWRRPLPVLVRINGKPAVPWRINMMPVGDGSFYLYLHSAVRRASGTKVGDRVRVEVGFDARYRNGPQHPVPAWFKAALQKNPQGPEELESADSEPEEGGSPLFRSAEIAGGARPQPRKSAPRALRQERTLHGAGVG